MRNQEQQQQQQHTHAYERHKTLNHYPVGTAASHFMGGSSGQSAVQSVKIDSLHTAFGGFTPTGYSVHPTNPYGDVSQPKTLLQAAPTGNGAQWGGLVVPKAALYISANRGLETLASSVDVEALDAAEAVSLPFQPTASKSLDLSLALRSSGAVAYNSRPELDLSVHQRLSSWTPGWKTEMGLETHEQALL